MTTKKITTAGDLPALLRIPEEDFIQLCIEIGQRRSKIVVNIPVSPLKALFMPHYWELCILLTIYHIKNQHPRKMALDSALFEASTWADIIYNMVSEDRAQNLGLYVEEVPVSDDAVEIETVALEQGAHTPLCKEYLHQFLEIAAELGIQNTAVDLSMQILWDKFLSLPLVKEKLLYFIRAVQAGVEMEQEKSGSSQ